MNRYRYCIYIYCTAFALIIILRMEIFIFVNYKSIPNLYFVFINNNHRSLYMFYYNS